MEIFTGHVNENHVTAEKFRAFVYSIFGKQSMILPVWERFAHVLESNNSLLIKRGMMVHNGNVSCTDELAGNRITIDNGSQGMNRIDLVVNRYKRNDLTGIESNEWVYIKGTPTSGTAMQPNFSKGDVMDGALEDDCPVFAIYLKGLQVTEVRCLIPVIKTFQDLKNAAFAEIATTFSACEKGNVFSAELGKELQAEQQKMSDSITKIVQKHSNDQEENAKFHFPEMLTTQSAVEGAVIDVPANSKRHLRVMLKVSGVSAAVEIARNSRDTFRVVNYFGGGTAMIMDCKMRDDTHLEIVRLWKEGAWKSYSAAVDVWAV